MKNRGRKNPLTSRIFEIVAAEFVVFTLLGLRYGNIIARLKPLAPLLVFLMLLQPMYSIEVGWGLLHRLRRRLRLLIASLLIYTVVYPVLAYILLVLPASVVTKAGALSLLAGVVLVALAPVAMPAPAFAALAGGDVELSLATVIVTFAAAPLVMPLWAHLLLHHLATAPIKAIIKSIAIYIGGSLVAAQAIRLLVRRVAPRPPEAAQAATRVAQTLALTSCLSLYILVAIVVGSAAPVLARLAGSVAALLALLLLYNAARYSVAYAVASKLGATCRERIAFTLIGSQNGALGMALAVPLGPLPAAGAVLAGPLVVLPTMAAVVRLLRCPHGG